MNEEQECGELLVELARQGDLEDLQGLVQDYREDHGGISASLYRHSDSRRVDEPIGINASVGESKRRNADAHVCPHTRNDAHFCGDGQVSARVWSNDEDYYSDYVLNGESMTMTSTMAKAMQKHNGGASRGFRNLKHKHGHKHHHGYDDGGSDPACLGLLNYRTRPDFVIPGESINPSFGVTALMAACR